MTVHHRPSSPQPPMTVHHNQRYLRRFTCSDLAGVRAQKHYYKTTLPGLFEIWGSAGCLTHRGRGFVTRCHSTCCRDVLRAKGELQLTHSLRFLRTWRPLPDARCRPMLYRTLFTTVRELWNQHIYLAIILFGNIYPKI